MSQHAPNGDDHTPPYGLPAKLALAKAIQKSDAATEAVEELGRQLKDVAQGVLDLHEMQGETMRAIIRVEGMCEKLSGDVKRVTVAPPPMRGELPSGIGFEEAVRQVTEAAVKGERSPVGTAEEEVAKVVESLNARREAAAAVKAADQRAKRTEKLFFILVSVIAAALAGHFIH